MRIHTQLGHTNKNYEYYAYLTVGKFVTHIDLSVQINYREPTYIAKALKSLDYLTWV